MDNIVIEVANLEKTNTEATDSQLHDLNDLQLALVGGGIGDTAI